MKPYHFAKIVPVNQKKRPELQQKMDLKTKPIGSLGVLEELAIRLAMIQNHDMPEIRLPTLVLCAGDHGLVAEGVSAYPQAVSSQMMNNFLTGGAAINCLTKQFSIHLQLVDCGLASPLNNPSIRSMRLGAGTANSRYEEAMSPEQLQNALDHGTLIVKELLANGCNTIALGEMGIGNSSAASLLIAKLLDLPLSSIVGPGAGCNDLQLQRKQDVLSAVLSRHADVRGPLESMQALGGFEMATAMGVMLAAGANRMAVVIDGFIMSAAALVALKAAPELGDYLFFGHLSASPGHKHMMDRLAIRPILDLGMRLGEGTGAALAVPLLQAACNLYRNMSTFEQAEVSQAIEERR